MVELLSGAGVNEEVCKVMGECVGVRQQEVRTHLHRDSSKVAPTSLTDFDWKLKVSRLSCTSWSKNLSLTRSTYLKSHQMFNVRTL